ncbi:MAG: alpha/beta fold hydrolase [Rhizobiaceae bacterium]
MKALKTTLTAIVILALFAGGFYFAFPKQAARMFMAGSLWITWMRRSTVEIDGYTIHTLDGGHGEPLVILHGIYSRKENWLKFGRKLDAYTRVVIPDIPGFGDNKLLPPEEYTVEKQAKRIIAMLDRLNIKKFHLAGSSMGGAIAAFVAHKRPDRIHSLAFLGGPYGVRSPRPSELDEKLASGMDNPLIVPDAASLTIRDAWLAPRTPYFHDMLRRAWPVEAAADAETQKRIWNKLAAHPPNLLAIAPKITAPTLVFWCDGDRVFDVSGAYRLAEALQKAKLHLMKDCGHSPVIDRSNWLAKHYVRDLKLIEAGVWPPHD